MSKSKRLVRHPLLIVISLVFGFGVQVVEIILFANAVNSSFAIDEPVVFAINSLLTALPLLVLSTQVRQHVLPWLIGAGILVWLTWWWLQKGVAYQRNPDGSGVDMSGAFVMLLSPFVIAAGCFWLNKVLTRRNAESA